jgi:putative PIN family toxin of toxin-antitoxin system
MRIVLDTNILVSAMLSGGGPARRVVRVCLQRAVTPLIGAALFAEYEDLLARHALFERARLDAGEREVLFDALMSVCEWTPIYYLWRPNLPDPGDDHLIELAIAGGANWVVTENIRDLSRGELKTAPLRIGGAAAFLEAWEKAQ